MVDGQSMIALERKTLKMQDDTPIEIDTATIFQSWTDTNRPHRPGKINKATVNK